MLFALWYMEFTIHKAMKYFYIVTIAKASAVGGEIYFITTVTNKLMWKSKQMPCTCPTNSDFDSLLYMYIKNGSQKH